MMTKELDHPAPVAEQPKFENTLQIVKNVISRPEVAEADTIDHYSQGVILVVVRLKFWYRLWAVLESDYRTGYRQRLQLELEERMSDDLIVTVIIAI